MVFNVEVTCRDSTRLIYCPVYHDDGRSSMSDRFI